MTHTVNHALIAQPSSAWSGSHIYSNKSKVGGTRWPGTYMTFTYTCMPRALLTNNSHIREDEACCLTKIVVSVFLRFLFRPQKHNNWVLDLHCHDVWLNMAPEALSLFKGRRAANRAWLKTEMHMLLCKECEHLSPINWVNALLCMYLPPPMPHDVSFFTSKNMPKQSTRKLKKRLI
jgi:hypothetical protein